MADSRQPEDNSSSHWAPPTNGAQDQSAALAGHGENGYSSYRENGYHGGHTATAEQVSAHIVEEVTAEAVAVLKQEQEQQDSTRRLPSVEDSVNLPPSPPPSPSAEQIGPMEQEERLEVVPTSPEEEEEEVTQVQAAPEEEHPGQQGEDSDQQPTDMLLEQVNIVSEPQALPCPQAETHKVLNGGRSHQAELDKPSEEDLPVNPEKPRSDNPAMAEEHPQGALPPQSPVAATAETETPEGAESTVSITESSSGSPQNKSLTDPTPTEPEKTVQPLVEPEKGQGTGSTTSVVPEIEYIPEPKTTAEKQPSVEELDSVPLSVVYEPLKDYIEEEEENDDYVTPSKSANFESVREEKEIKSEKTEKRMLSLGQSTARPLSFETEKIEDTPQSNISEGENPKAHISAPDGLKDKQSSEDKSGVASKDESGMTAYFETSTQRDTEEPGEHAEGYYELSAVSQKKPSEKVLEADSKIKISHSAPEQTESSTTLTSDSAMDKLEDLPKRKDACTRLSPGKLSLEQRSLSLNFTIGSMGQAGEQNQSKLSSLTEISSGSLDETTGYLPVTTPLVTLERQFLPVTPEIAIPVPTTEAATDPPEDTTSTTSKTTSSPKLSLSPMKQHYTNLNDPFNDLPEMLDLAGVNPKPTLEKRELDQHNRRRSVPACPSAALVGSSLAKLVLGNQQTPKVVDGGESQQEERGYCVFSEYSGPMPSPADLHSPVGSPHQRFPTVTEGDSDEELGAIAEEGEQKVAPQKPNQAEDSVGGTVKPTLVLERAVTAGVKPDRLRIPVAPSKDKLTEFRLESGLPGDIKTQAIPEVELEQDLSREASPIPPDFAFTFGTEAKDAKLRATPESPAKKAATVEGTKAEETTAEVKAEVASARIGKSQKTGHEKPEMEEVEENSDPDHQDAVEDVQPKDVQGPEREKKERPVTSSPESLVEIINAQEKKRESEPEASTVPAEAAVPKEEGKTKAEETSPTPSNVSTAEVEEATEQQQEKSPEKRVSVSSPVIVIPQAQVEEEEEDDIEVAEEVLEEVEGPPVLLKEKEQESHPVEKQEEMAEEVRVVDGAEEVIVENPKDLEITVSADDESCDATAPTIDEGDYADHISHLSACSDKDQPQTLDGQEEEKNEVEDKEGVVLQEEEESGEVGQETETSDVLQSQTDETTTHDETTMDVSMLDTDSGWVDSQGNDDRSLMTEQIEALPKTQSPVKTPLVERPSNKRPPGRGQGRVSTPERKPTRREPISRRPKEEEKKKKAGTKRTEQCKVSVLQSRSPTRRSVVKAATFRQSRPASHHGSARCKPPAMEDRQPLNVAHQSRERTSSLTRTALKNHRLTRGLEDLSPRPNSACSHTKSKPLVEADLCGPRPSSACSGRNSPSPSLQRRGRREEKEGTYRSPEKRSSLPRPASSLPRRAPPAEQDNTSPAPRRPTSGTNSSARSRSARSGASTPHTPGSTAVTPGTPPSYSCRTPGSRTPGSHTPKSLSLLTQEKKFAVIRTPPKSPSTTPKQLRVLNQPLPDLKNIKSKIGSTDNMKYQPKGGQVFIPSVKLDFSHVQSKCGSLDKIQYAPTGGNVHITTKKIDLSHITSKCGSMSNIRHRPGGGNVRIESVKLDFKDKAEAKVGSLANASHTPGGGQIMIESHKLTFRDTAKARVDHGADVITLSPGGTGGTSPHRLSNVSSTGSLNLLDSPQLSTLAQDVTMALAKQGL
ncbi:microtubule-associated protein 2 isoform X3 [Coregonus clupeaformis]|uniref:microtubule-associated protein 2 isoform X3 n=1 Tax=Coregonus clupeaformis TaxID=59861 RepID=UPI001E1C54B9|nr:microtubule-associated protein 2 isoform X3 [Coregonus clupeaformis]